MNDFKELVNNLVEEVNRKNKHWKGYFFLTGPLTFQIYNLSRYEPYIKLEVDIDNVDGMWFKLYLYTNKGNYYGSYENVRLGGIISPAEMLLHKILPECIEQIRAMYGVTKYRTFPPPELDVIYSGLDTLIEFTKRERLRWNE